jgi:hypothetical protein
MFRSFATWLLLAGVVLLGVDRYFDREQVRTDPAAVERGQDGAVHSMDDGAGQPPPTDCGC